MESARMVFNYGVVCAAFMAMFAFAGALRFDGATFCLLFGLFYGLYTGVIVYQTTPVFIQVGGDEEICGHCGEVEDDCDCH